MNVVLDTADGLTGETFVDCSIMFTADRKTFKPRGEVVLDRRNAIRDSCGTCPTGGAGLSQTVVC